MEDEEVRGGLTPDESRRGSRYFSTVLCGYALLLLWEGASGHGISLYSGGNV